MAKKDIDWESLEREYRAGIRSLRDIAEQFGCSEGAIRKKASRDSWVRDFSSADNSQSKRVATKQEDLYSRSGFVYVLFIEDSSGIRFYKVGMASSLSERIKTHQCSSPFLVQIACSYFTENMRREERSIHEQIKDKKIRGEWFDLSHEDLIAISGRSLLV